MSFDIKWYPLDNASVVPTTAPSAVWDVLKHILDGDELHASHLGALRALARADPGNGVWPHLIAAVEKHGTILLVAS